MSTLHHAAADKGVPMTLGELRHFVDRALGFDDDAELFDLDGNPVDRLTLADKTEAPFDPNAGTEQPWYQDVDGARAWGFKPGLPGTSVHESVEAGLRRQHALTHVDGTTCPTCAVFAAPRDTPVTPQEHTGDNPDVVDGLALDAVRQCADVDPTSTEGVPYELLARVFKGAPSALNKALDRLVKGGTLVYTVTGYRVVQ